jgi:hypothetical protein
MRQSPPRRSKGPRRLDSARLRGQEKAARPREQGGAGRAVLRVGLHSSGPSHPFLGPFPAIRRVAHLAKAQTYINHHPSSVDVQGFWRVVTSAKRPNEFGLDWIGPDPLPFGPPCVAPAEPLRWDAAQVRKRMLRPQPVAFGEAAVLVGSGRGVHLWPCRPVLQTPPSRRRDQASGQATSVIPRDDNL